jgi:predicted AAA+ superfamily ATPase
MHGMDRIYEAALKEHFAENRQMAFLTGPRQVGKTTTCRAVARGGPYLNWDSQDDRALVLRGPRAVADALRLHELRAQPPTVVFDELHKYPKWRGFLKGFYDIYGEAAKVAVTGSARLDLYRRGGDSLLGRYFPYRMHPVSVAETLHSTAAELPVRPPKQPTTGVLAHLLEYGGFPEPFLRGETRFANRWRALRRQVLIREDLRDLTRVTEIGQLDVLVAVLTRQSGALANYSSLAREVSVSVDTVRRWLRLLQALYVVFEVRPWHRNVAKSLRKQPKFYLWEWSEAPGDGPRFENLVAGHLLKAVHWWTDRGLGTYRLHFVRDVAGHEADFLVTRDDQPWFLVEAKATDHSLSSALGRFQTATGAAHAFQVVRDLPFVDRDCFALSTPMVVPAATFLSQLV